MTLATLFDFPFEERRKLTMWSDTMTTAPGHGPWNTYEERRQLLADCRAYFVRLWNERVNAEPARRPDLDAGARPRHARLPRWTSTSPTSPC